METAHRIQLILRQRQSQLRPTHDSFDGHLLIQLRRGRQVRLRLVIDIVTIFEILHRGGIKLDLFLLALDRRAANFGNINALPQLDLSLGIGGRLHLLDSQLAVGVECHGTLSFVDIFRVLVRLGGPILLLNVEDVDVRGLADCQFWRLMLTLLLARFE